MTSKQPHNPHNPNPNASVVPDLMRVYESMTQSSTPQTNHLNTHTNNNSVSSPNGDNKKSSPATGDYNSTSDLHHHPPNPIALPTNLTGNNSTSNSNNYTNDMFNTAANLAQSDASNNNNNSNNMSSYSNSFNNLNPLNHLHNGLATQLSPYPPTSDGRTSTSGGSGDIGYTNTGSSSGGGITTRHHTKKQRQQSTQVSIQSEPTTTSSSSTRTTTKKSTRNTRKRSLASSKNNNNSSSTDAITDSKGRKKGGDKDGRWSKRFAWPDELHRDFVAAVFDVGLKHSSPSAILEQMPPNEQITSERIKSHLQKYRLHRQKSKKEFMVNYDASLVKLKAGTMSNVDDPSSMNFGEVAAHLSYRTMNDVEMENRNAAMSMSMSMPSTMMDINGMMNSLQGGVLHLPKLTEEEKLTPVGASMGYLMGLFFSLKKQLMAQRGIAVDDTTGNESSNNGVPAAVSSAATALASFDQGGHSLPTGGGGGQDPSSYNQYGGGNDNEYYSYNQNQSSYEQNQPYENENKQNTSTSQQQEQQQQPYYSEPPQVSFNSNSTTTASAVAQDPSSHDHHPHPERGGNSSSMEESRLMKRDMRNQMAFQNKMRKLKEQEFSKYSQQGDMNTDGGSGGGEGRNDILSNSGNHNGRNSNVKSQSSPGDNDVVPWNPNITDGQQDIDEEQLFDFLMSDLHSGS